MGHTLNQLLSGNPDGSQTRIKKAAEEAKQISVNVKPQYLKNMMPQGL